MCKPLRKGDGVTPRVGRSRAVAALFDPKSVAVIGASTKPHGIGGRPLGLLRARGYQGAVFPVNHAHSVVQGERAYPSIGAVPEPVDVAMIAVPAERVPEVLRECAQAGVKLAVVVSSGFGEGQGGGLELAEEVRTDLLGTDMRVLGPNCEGFASLRAQAPVTFSPVLDYEKSGAPLKAGGVTVLSQSGGLGFAVAQWGSEAGIGFNHIVSTGNEIDLDILDIAAEAVEDPGTSIVVMLLEGFREPARMRSIADRALALGKIFMIVKLGVSDAGVRGALAHTRHDAGTPAEYGQVLDHPAIQLIADADVLIDLLQARSKCPPMAGRRVAVVTTSGGAGVWTSDACRLEGLQLPILSPATQAKLAGHMPAYGSPINPVDLTAQFIAGGQFAPAMEVLADSGEVDGIVLVTTLSAPGRLENEREALAALIGRSPIPIVVYAYTRPARACIDLLEDIGLAWYTGSHRAARGIASLAPAIA
jgi:acyl-CoA synthetase (NDP forming)